MSLIDKKWMCFEIYFRLRKIAKFGNGQFLLERFLCIQCHNEFFGYSLE